MVTVKLQGGLGNQLFQYATARALAWHHGTSVAFDLSFFQNLAFNANITPRQFALDAFDLSPSPPPLVVGLSHGLIKVPFKNALQRIARQRYPVTEYREQSFRYDPAIWDSTSINTHLIGYFQTELYFEKIRDRLLEELEFMTRAETKVADMIGKSQSVSLHIRRGDYASNPTTQRLHGLCSLDYYERAAAYLAGRLEAMHLFVFSDDAAWARINLVLPYPTTFVGGGTDADSHRDMQSMSQCRHHIIANSSFSWWGAWLNPSPDKIVIGPQRWFADEAAQAQTQDLIPAAWIRM